MIFLSDDGFDEPFKDTADHAYYDGYGPDLDPRLLIAVILVILLVIGLVALANFMGRRYGLRKRIAQRKTSAEAIFKSVNWYLDRALKSSGAVVVERGREVAEILNSRLGYVIDLSSRQYKLFTDLKSALEGMKDSVPADPTPKVNVALATDQHQYRVWKALQALDEFWKAKDADGKYSIIRMIEAAQAELSTPPAREPVTAMPAFPKMTMPKWGAKTTRPLKAATAAAIVPTPEPAPQPSATDEAPPPEPTPPPPPPPAPKKTKGLPAHKRNMLA